MSTEHLLGDIGLILDAIPGNDDAKRKEAETHLGTLTRQHPAEVLLLLAQIGALGVGGFQLDHRLLALILLNRQAFRKLDGLFLNPSEPVPSEPIDVIRETSRTRIEVVLCAGLRDEIDIKVRKGLGLCAAKWAEGSSKRQRPCINFPPILLQLTTSPQPFHRFTPFQILNIVPNLLIDSVSEPLPVSQLAGILLAGLNDPSIDVRIEAMKSLCSVLCDGMAAEEREEVGAQLVSEAFKTLSRLPPNLLSHGLTPLISLAGSFPKPFIPSIPEIFPSLLSCLAPPGPLPPHPFSEYPPSTLTVGEWEDLAKAATEIILTLVELQPDPVLAWQSKSWLKDLVGLWLANLVVCLGEEDETCRAWLEETNLEEEDDSYPGFAEECLDRLTVAVHGETVLPILLDHAQSLLHQSDWRCRYTALVAIGSISDGCSDELQTQIEPILILIAPAAGDRHPRVRWGFVNCMALLCEYGQDVVQNRFAEPTLAIFTELLSDPAGRVRHETASAISNYFSAGGGMMDDGAREVKAVRIARIAAVFPALIKAFEMGPVYVQEQALASISRVAFEAVEAFLPYYRRVMDICLRILSVPCPDTHRRLVGRAMECATYCGLPVGKKKFALDGVRLAKAMANIQNSIKSSDDPRNRYLMDAWANLCTVLGEDFVPFLPTVIPPLLKAASYVQERPNASADSQPEDPEQKLDSAYTSELDDQVLAFDNLSIYAKKMKGAFFPWLDLCMGPVLGALGTTRLSAARESAAALVPHLLEVAKISMAWSQRPEVLVHIITTFIQNIALSSEFYTLTIVYQSFFNTMKVVATALPADLLATLLGSTDAHLLVMSRRRGDRNTNMTYYDAEEWRYAFEEQDEEDACLIQMKRVMDEVLSLAGQDNLGKELEGTASEVYKKIEQVRATRIARTRRGSVRGRGA